MELKQKNINKNNGNATQAERTDLSGGLGADVTYEQLLGELRSHANEILKLMNVLRKDKNLEINIYFRDLEKYTMLIDYPKV